MNFWFTEDEVKKIFEAPFLTDTILSHEKIGWAQREQFSVQARIPMIMDRFYNHNRLWEKKNILRNQRQYLYTDD